MPGLRMAAYSPSQTRGRLSEGSCTHPRHHHVQGGAEPDAHGHSSAARPASSQRRYPPWRADRRIESYATDVTLGSMSGELGQGLDAVEARARRYSLQRRASWLIGRTVDDLRDRAESEDEYTLLGIAGIVRRALFEKHALADLERSRQRLPDLEFRYRSAPIRPSSIPIGTQIRLPVLGRFREPAELGALSQFRKAPVATSDAQAISVESLVKHFAHVEGGVHVGYPGDDTEDALGAIFGFRSEGWRHGLGLLGDIGFVVAEGLAPLVAADRAGTTGDSSAVSGAVN